MFFQADGKTPKVFYYRETFVDVPATSNWTFEGMMGDLEKVRFDIQKDLLVGYRSYDYAPGARSLALHGQRDAHATADAQAGQPPMRITPHHLVQQRDQDPAARSADRMADYMPSTGRSTRQWNLDPTHPLRVIRADPDYRSRPHHSNHGTHERDPLCPPTST
jgi:hypothetical protein